MKEEKKSRNDHDHLEIEKKMNRKKHRDFIWLFASFCASSAILGKKKLNCKWILWRKKNQTERKLWFKTISQTIPQEQGENKTKTFKLNHF